MSYIRYLLNNCIILMFNDFQKQKGIKFDIIKLRQALKQVVGKSGFDDAEGTKHFGAISLNQIPGDPESTKGKNVRCFLDETR